jgi:hypothetical protein
MKVYLIYRIEDWCQDQLIRIVEEADFATAYKVFYNYTVLMEDTGGYRIEEIEVGLSGGPTGSVWILRGEVPTSRLA